MKVKKKGHEKKKQKQIKALEKKVDMEKKNNDYYYYYLYILQFPPSVYFCSSHMRYHGEAYILI